MYGIPGLIGKLRPLMNEAGSTDCMLLALYNHWVLGKSMSYIVFNKILNRTKLFVQSQRLTRPRAVPGMRNTYEGQVLG